jgi:hypothetical protein
MELRYGLMAFQQMLLGGVLFFRVCESRSLPNRSLGVFVEFQHKPIPMLFGGLDFDSNIWQYVQEGIYT